MRFNSGAYKFRSKKMKRYKVFGFNKDNCTFEFISAINTEFAVSIFICRNGRFLKYKTEET